MNSKFNFAFSFFVISGFGPVTNERSGGECDAAAPHKGGVSGRPPNSQITKKKLVHRLDLQIHNPKETERKP